MAPKALPTRNITKKTSSQRVPAENLLAKAAARARASPKKAKKSIKAGVAVAVDAASKGRSSTISERKKLTPIGRAAEKVTEKAVRTLSKKRSPKKAKASPKRSSKKAKASPKRSSKKAKSTPKKRSSKKAKSTPKKRRSSKKGSVTRPKRALTKYNLFAKSHYASAKSTVHKKSPSKSGRSLSQSVFKEIGRLWRAQGGGEHADRKKMLASAKRHGIHGRSRLSPKSLLKAVNRGRKGKRHATEMTVKELRAHIKSKEPAVALSKLKKDSLVRKYRELYPQK